MNSTSQLQDALRNATDTCQIRIGTGTLASMADIFKQAFNDQSVVIIAAENTFDLERTSR